MSDATNERVAEAVCHDDQTNIWTGEIAGALSMAGYLRDDLEYHDVIDIHQILADEVRRIVGSALAADTTPALSARVVELEGEVADMKRVRIEHIKTIKGAQRRAKQARNDALREAAEKAYLAADIDARPVSMRKAILALIKETTDEQQ